MRVRIRQFWHEKSGSTAIEYAMMAALLALAAMVGAEALGNSVTGMYENSANRVQEATER